MPTSFTASTLLCLLISSTATDPVLSEGSFTFTHPIHNIATGRKHVLVATENSLYLFNHMLHNLTVRHPGSDIGSKKNCAGREVPQVYYNKILLVYNDTVLSCWNEDSGVCREYDVNNLTLLKGFGDNIVSCNPEHTAAGFISQKDNNIIFVTAAPTLERKTTSTVQTRAIAVRKRTDDVFTFIHDNNVVLLKTSSPVLNFVDAFELEGKFTFPYYLSNGLGARLIVLEGDLDVRFNSQYNLTCGTEPQRGVILSSFVFASSGSFFWAGIFSTNHTRSPDTTALCIYNITFIKDISRGCIHTDFQVSDYPDCKTFPNPLPVNSKPTISHGDLTAVYVLEVNTTLVLFLGTGNGRLLKGAKLGQLTQVLHEFKSEAAVFKTMRLDPLDDNYLYVATTNEIKRVRVAKCEQYQSCNECLASADPHCGWCLINNSCMMKAECEATSLENWIGISNGYGKCFGIHVTSADKNQITLSIKKNPLLFGRDNTWSCKLQKKDTVLCNGTADRQSLSCSCPFPSVQSSNQAADRERAAAVHVGRENGRSSSVAAGLYEETGLPCLSPAVISSPDACHRDPEDMEEKDREDVLTAIAVHNYLTIVEHFQFDKCSQYSGISCLECISNGCLYCTKESACRSPLNPCEVKADEVTVTTVQPDRIIYSGRKNVLITGENLQNLSKMFLVGASSCKPQEIRIEREKYWNSTHAFISLPSAKDAKQLCVNFNETCHQGLNIFYVSVPTCSVNLPNSVWFSGGRKLSLSGKGLDLVEEFSIAGSTFVSKGVECSENKTHCYLIAKPLSETNQPTFSINIHIEENNITCGIVHYKPDPIFTSYTAVDVGYVIEKKKDELHIRADEIQVFINSNLTCKVQNITEWTDEDTVFCKVDLDNSKKIDVNKIEVKVILGNYIKRLDKDAAISPYIYILLVIPLLLAIVIATCVITRYKSKKLSEKLSKQLEQLECDIRQEIRDGFAEFQMDKEDVAVEALGTIPFFDYKHFALKTFFPEPDGNKQDLSEKLCENVPSPFQKNARNPTDEDDTVTSLKNLFENQNFLVMLIHILEKQKDFSVKDRCFFASYLTIIFQNNLLYLTGLLETLTKDLIEQSNSKNPKLMLRRTESVVEKLLTNWMATCLYGFLRESVGEPLYGLVCTLNQRIHKGPIDVITCKALYTLNEDWLLWQVTDFNNVDINVHYPTPEGEAIYENSQCLKVTVLDCDTIRQVKEKILQTYLSKNGYSFSCPLCDICLQYHFGQTYKELLDIDASSVVMENDLKKLNTVKHYKVEDGACDLFHVFPGRLGDFNNILDSTLDSSNPARPPGTELRSWAETAMMEEVWRWKHPGIRTYSHLSHVHGSSARIDMPFGKQAMLGMLNGAAYLPGGLSDHVPLSITFSVPGGRRSGGWKLSPEWLREEGVAQRVSPSLLTYWHDNVGTASAPVVWDAFKATTRGEYISGIKAARREHSAALTVLQDEEAICAAAYADSPGESTVAALKKARRSINCTMLG
ncbi:PREDICTED: plexin-C1-like [Nanorana parkeri]|uniref:plexin-C1-like n=1 Tax=Nanorana parkeri TaxID=125878 RepID=UPI000854CADE|nr:PREDICTED: plexin-C1-like [Nanorana parkeri]